MLEFLFQKCDGISGVNFIIVKSKNFSYKCRFGSFYYVHVIRKKAAKMKFVQKIRAFNVHEIDYRPLSDVISDGSSRIKLQWYYPSRRRVVPLQFAALMTLHSYISFHYKSFSFTVMNLVEDVAKISANKFSIFDFFNFYITTCFNQKQVPLQVGLHFELT